MLPQVARSYLTSAMSTSSGSSWQHKAPWKHMQLSVRCHNIVGSNADLAQNYCSVFVPVVPHGRWHTCAACGWHTAVFSRAMAYGWRFGVYSMKKLCMYIIKFTFALCKWFSTSLEISANRSRLSMTWHAKEISSDFGLSKPSRTGRRKCSKRGTKVKPTTKSTDLSSTGNIVAFHMKPAWSM